MSHRGAENAEIRIKIRIRKRAATDEHRLTQIMSENTSKWKCRGCGCTNERACKGGCSWAEKNLCDQCLHTAENFTKAEVQMVVFGLRKALSCRGLSPEHREAARRTLRRMELVLP